MSRKKSKGPTARSTGGSRPRKKRCGLCGKTGKLVRTECCGQWICGDEDSYGRNGCIRNHRRKTLCRYHFWAGHEGSWKDCSVCRGDFETELYVYFGTNEYNFEPLADPPEYEPTLCLKCGKTLVLGEGGYCPKKEGYLCLACGEEDFRRSFRKTEESSEAEGDS